MRSSTLLSLWSACAWLAQHARADEEPNLPYDRNTISTCIFWYDNVYGKTCEEVRASTPSPRGDPNVFTPISQEDFTRWNPSVNANCDKWETQSYCVWIEDEVYMDADPETTSSALPPASTTVPSATEIPLPAWTPMGCFEDADLAIRTLGQFLSQDQGDMSTYRCQDICFYAGHAFAGLRGGDECRCDGFVGGELATNATDSCNLPCLAEPEEPCGGVAAINVYQNIAGLKLELPPLNNGSGEVEDPFFEEDPLDDGDAEDTGGSYDPSNEMEWVFDPLVTQDD